MVNSVQNKGPDTFVRKITKLRSNIMSEKKKKVSTFDLTETMVDDIPDIVKMRYSRTSQHSVDTIHDQHEKWLQTSIKHLRDSKEIDRLYD